MHSLQRCQHRYQFDNLRFDQVIRNLITNAVKFSQSGEGVVAVTITTTSDIKEVNQEFSTKTKATLVGSLRVDVH